MDNPTTPATTETAPRAVPVRPLTTAELAGLAKTGHRRCGGSGWIVVRAAGTEPGDESERRGWCRCLHQNVEKAIDRGLLVRERGVLWLAVSAPTEAQLEPRVSTSAVAAEISASCDGRLGGELDGEAD